MSRLLGNSAVSSDSYDESPLHQPTTTYYNQSAHPVSAQPATFDPLRAMSQQSSSSNYNDGNDYGFSAQSPSSAAQSYNQPTYASNQTSYAAPTSQSNYSSNVNYSSNNSINNQSNYSTNSQSNYSANNQSNNQAGTTAFYGAAPVAVGQSGSSLVYGYAAPQSFVPQQLNQIGYGSSDLVRITRVPTPFALNKHAIWPTEYPLFTNSSIGYYVSNSEWNKTIASINQSFSWKSFEMVLHYGLLVSIVFLFALYYLVLMAGSGQSFTLAVIRWVAILVLTGIYAFVLRWSRLRSLNRMMVQVQFESRQYSQADNLARPGKLACSWHVDGDQLVVTALTSGNGQQPGGYAASSGGYAPPSSGSWAR